MAHAKLPRRKVRRELGAHEAIRVVPLHHPQFQRAATPNLAYRGGALVAAAKVVRDLLGENLGNEHWHQRRASSYEYILFRHPD